MALRASSERSLRNECIHLCNDIIEEEDLESLAGPAPPTATRRPAIADQPRTVQRHLDALARRLEVLADRAHEDR